MSTQPIETPKYKILQRGVKDNYQIQEDGKTIATSKDLEDAKKILFFLRRIEELELSSKLMRIYDSKTIEEMNNKELAEYIRKHNQLWEGMFGQAIKKACDSLEQIHYNSREFYFNASEAIRKAINCDNNQTHNALSAILRDVQKHVGTEAANTLIHNYNLTKIYGIEKFLLAP